MLFAQPRSDAQAIAHGLAWLWRLGPVAAEPDGQSVGIGTAAEANALARLVDDGALAGAVVLVEQPGPADGALPARRTATGPARFDSGELVSGDHCLLDGGEPVVRSSIGAHAVRKDGVLFAGTPPNGAASLHAFWLFSALARFVAETLERPLLLLPPLGCLRLDDAPGTAELQLLGAAKSDAEEVGRIERIVTALRAAGAKLTVAVAARALEGDRQVPIENVWPRSIDALAAGVHEGVLEPACHGLLHLDEAARADGRIEPREFLRLTRDEAGARLDAAIEWMTERLARPPTFIAPAWGYSDGALAAAAERGLYTWTAPAPGPLIDGLQLRETLADGLPGLERLDYSPLARLADAGVPPTVVFHGRLLDGRVERLRARRDVVSFARLLRRRDLERIAAIPAIRWVGGGELAERLAAHDRTRRLDGDRFELPAGCDAVVLRPDGKKERIHS